MHMERIVVRPRAEKIVVINSGRWFSSLRLRLYRNAIKTIQNSTGNNQVDKINSVTNNNISITMNT